MAGVFDVVVTEDNPVSVACMIISSFVVATVIAGRASRSLQLKIDHHPRKNNGRRGETLSNKFYDLRLHNNNVTRRVSRLDEKTHPQYSRLRSYRNRANRYIKPSTNSG